MEYQTKRARITDYLRLVFATLKSKKKKGSKSLILSNTSLSLGVKESDIEAVLQTYQDANIVEVKGDEIIV